MSIQALALPNFFSGFVSSSKEKSLIDRLLAHLSGGMQGPSWGEKSPPVKKTFITDWPAHFPGQEAWERKVPPHPMSDEKSQQWAWEFAQQRRRFLVAQARNICRNSSEAEDLVHEAIVRFVQNAHRLETRNERVCESYLVRTLKNIFFDQCRKKKVEEQGAQDPHLSEQTVEVPEPDVPDIQDLITHEHFEAGLKTLSPKLRETFELYAAGKSYQEISKLLGVPVGTVGKRLSDARAKLREFFTKKGGK
jgi:RNA polymerase sigma-70 factor (ECF subfamily)